MRNACALALWAPAALQAVVAPQRTDLAFVGHDILPSWADEHTSCLCKATDRFERFNGWHSESWSTLTSELALGERGHLAARMAAEKVWHKP